MTGVVYLCLVVSLLLYSGCCRCSLVTFNTVGTKDRGRIMTSLSGILILTAITIPSCTSQTTLRTPTPDPWGLPQEWDKNQVPNPQTDLYKCGRGGRRSWVCDPNSILTEEQANTIDALIDRLRYETGGCHCEKQSKCPSDVNYGGWQAGIAVLKKFRSTQYLSRDELTEEAEEFADHLRDDSWEFGVCNDDFVIVLSVEDRVVYTKTGDEMSSTLTDSCVSSITQSVSQQYFKDDRWADGLMYMVGEYREALQKEHPCNKGNSVVTFIAIGVIGGIIGLIVVIVIVGKRMGCQCSGGGGGGGYSSTNTHTGRRSSFSFRRSSNSSGGAGGTF